MTGKANDVLSTISTLYLNNFVIQKQLKSNWCWAAVTASLASYYGKNEFVDQKQLVRAIINQNCCDGIGCGKCNRPWYVGESLDYVGLLRELLSNPVSKDRLITELRNNNPVVIASKCEGIASGHAFVINSIKKINGSIHF